MTQGADLQIPHECLAASVLGRHEHDLARIGSTLRTHTDQLADLQMRREHGDERLAQVERDQRELYRTLVALSEKIDGLDARQSAILQAIQTLEAATGERHRLLLQHINGSVLTRERDITSRLDRFERGAKLAIGLTAGISACTAALWVLYRALMGQS